MSATAGPLRILVVDDHPIVRAGIIALLSDEADMQVIGEANDGSAAVAAVAEHQPDVVLMDLRMPIMDGDAATAAILAEHPDTKILILTTFESDESILRAIEAGARGYLMKAAPAEELLAAIRAVARGEAALSPAIATMLVQRLHRPAPTEAAVHLTAREREVLALVAEGQSNPEIAASLVVSEATVKTHLLRIFAKLGVQDRTRAVTRAMELGVLDMPQGQ